MMFLRIKALYNRQYVVLGIVAFMGIFSFSMNAALMTRGVAVVHNPRSGVRGMCVFFVPLLKDFLKISPKHAL